ncbi:MAG: type II toxin-antitoxin system prevent-host-death family antitoxin [Caulobacter sp.]|nr:type II toxin-antitoxin system prevent-host-death family antitoxin [Caulobacter sp.]
MIYTVHQAKTQLSKLLAQAEAGEEVIIARGKAPSVRLIPIAKASNADTALSGPRVPGAWKGRFELPDSFFDPLPQEELALWEGGID